MWPTPSSVVCARAGIIFVINVVVPDTDPSIDLGLKKAAFLFKKRYMAEVLMNEAPADPAPGGPSLRLRTTSGASTASATTSFRITGAVDYEADWRSGSDLSDAYEVDDAAQDSAPAHTTCTTPVHTRTSSSTRNTRGR